MQTKSSRFHFCGGSIIEPDIVVTAAHCVNGHSILVQAGLLDLNNPPSYSQVREVQKIAAHEAYTDLSNDIALLKLVSPFDFAESQGHIGAVCLPAKNRPLKNNVEVTGWGTTSSGGRASSLLLAVSVPVRSNTVCTIGTFGSYDSKTMFCAGSPGKDSCQGDSGGPAVQKESGASVLVGVVSYGLGCAVFPGVYTRMPAYTDWVPANIAKLQS
ncbi:unnamed protein product [Ixodes hexagonus]